MRKRFWKISKWKANRGSNPWSQLIFFKYFYDSSCRFYRWTRPLLQTTWARNFLKLFLFKFFLYKNEARYRKISLIFTRYNVVQSYLPKVLCGIRRDGVPHGKESGFLHWKICPLISFSDLFQINKNITLLCKSSNCVGLTSW